MTKGFLLSCDEKYAQLAEVAARSLLDFSSHGVQLVTYGWETELKHDRLIPKPLSVKCAKRLWGTRILESPFDMTCMLDCDSVATPVVDNIFNWGSELDYPTYMVHPHMLNLDKFEIQMAKLGAPASAIPYVHGAPCIATSRQEKFLHYYQNLLEQGRKFQSGGDAADEQLTNFALRSVGATYCMPFGIAANNCHFATRNRSPWTCLYHGEKDIAKAEQMLIDMQK